MDRRARRAARANTSDAPAFRRLFELNRQPMWIYDCETLEFLDVNDAAIGHYGYSRRELLARTLRDIRPTEDIPRLVRRISEIRNDPATDATLWRHLKQNGSVIDVEVTSLRVSFANRSARIAILRDVTDRVRAEATIRALLCSVARAQEEERVRIARELHDDTAQSLTLLLLELRKVAEAQSLEAARTRARELRADVARALGEVRRIARGLRPMSLEAFGLGEALRRLAAELRSTHQLEVHVQLSGLDAPLPEPVEIALYRMAQEALTNAWKHASASTISIVAERTQSSVRLIVEDDGRGFHADCALEIRTLGLRGIRERALLLGGELTIESSPGAGTTLRVSVPLSEADR
jgi:PAS domain S-box-containing protein